MAYTFMIGQDDVKILSAKGGNERVNDSEMTVSEKLYQRFAMLSLWYSLSANTETPPYEDECSWRSVECYEEKVEGVYLARKLWEGEIPTTIGLLKSLKVLDLSDNRIKGSIPEELYECKNLTHVYLHDNKLTGTLSESILNLYGLEELFLGSNALSGSIPRNLRSISKTTPRPLRYLVLGKNKFSGNLLPDFNLNDLFYFDLSYNSFSGTIPPDFFEKQFVRLRLLYFDHNNFSGSIPLNLMTAGNGRLMTISLSYNMFTGAVPFKKSWVENNGKLGTLDVRNNQIRADISKKICDMSVFEDGDLVQLGADCDICTCDKLCNYCKSGYGQDGQ